jgi:RNA polymerase sigma factor (sigma-70 family)
MTSINNGTDLTAEQYYLENQGLIHTVCKKVSGRVKSAHIPMEYEDIFQELSIIFLKALAKFDVDRGGKFSTYFIRSAYNRLNKIIEKEAGLQIGLGLISIDQPMGESDDEMDGFDIASNDLCPESRAICDNYFNTQYKRLSKNAKNVIEWFINPPAFIQEEIDKRNEKAMIGRSQGISTHRVAFTSATVLTIYVRANRLSKSQRYRIHNEIALLMKLI